VAELAGQHELGVGDGARQAVALDDVGEDGRPSRST
jgi:hypothetical protein